MIFVLTAALLAVASVSPSPAATTSPIATMSPAPALTPPPATSAPTPSPVSSFLAPGSVPNAKIWQGVTPGGSLARIRAARGPSLLSRILPDGSALDWYPGPSDNAYVIIASRHDVVMYVRAFPVDQAGSLTGLTDPYGITPGDDFNKVRSRRGNPKEGRKLSDKAAIVWYPGGGYLLWLYEFDNTVLHAISLIDTHAAAPPPSAPPVRDPHDGTTISRAYVIRANNEQTGVRFERYYATHRGGCGTWLITNQTLLMTGGRQVDQLDLECEDNKGQTSMFFDVTSFFGKL